MKALKENGSISEDVLLLFDEMYLQKCEEYVGGGTVGTDEDGELYKGVVCFMIVGLNSNILATELGTLPYLMTKTSISPGICRLD